MLSVKPQNDIVLASGLRTAFVRAGGAFRREDAGHLGARVAREVLARSCIVPGYRSSPHSSTSRAERVMRIRRAATSGGNSRGVSPPFSL